LGKRRWRKMLTGKGTKLVSQKKKGVIWEMWVTLYIKKTTKYLKTTIGGGGGDCSRGSKGDKRPHSKQ